MNRTKLNYVTDAVAFAGFLVLTSTGILLRYLLPPGSGGSHGSSLGQGAQEKSISVLWGWTRHDWGDFHYYLALGFMAVLAFHLVLHWKWIACVTRGQPTEGSGHRLALGAIGLVGVVLLSAAPLIGPVEKTTRRAMQTESATESEHADEHVVRGEMTLEEVAELADVSVADLIKELDLPAGTQPSEHVGRLRRQHDFTMEQLREFVGEKATR